MRQRAAADRICPDARAHGDQYPAYGYARVRDEDQQAADN